MVGKTLDGVERVRSTPLSLALIIDTTCGLEANDQDRD